MSTLLPQLVISSEQSTVSYKRSTVSRKILIYSLPMSSRPAWPWISWRGIGLSSNYLNVELATAREPHRIVEVTAGGVTAAGVRERGAFAILG